MVPSSDWSVIVIAGGHGRRLGGVDKAGIVLGGVTTLDLILDSIAPEMPVVVSGPERPTHRPVVFTQESPPDGGPVAGIAAALTSVTTPGVLIVATDMPWAAELVPELLARFASTSADVVIPVDSGGRSQPLLSAWDAQTLRGLLAGLGDPRGRSVRDLTERTTSATWALDERETALIADIDTAAELQAARARADEPRLAGASNATHNEGVLAMEEWIQAVRLELGIDDSVDVDVILDVARVAAHNVARPAAPVTTFLLGVAVGRGADLAESAALVSALADRWPPSA